MKLNSTTSCIQAIISLVLIFISTNLLYSQNPEWITFKRGEGILSFAVEGNYLWIGTKGWGLVKQNTSNYEFMVYDSWNCKLPSHNVRNIAIDGQGNKWIGTDAGLVKFSGVNWTIYNTSNSNLPSDNVLAIAIDAQGNKWKIGRAHV